MKSFALIPLLSICFAYGCSSESEGRSNEVETRSNASNIINGTDSPANQDEVIQLRDYDPSQQPVRAGVCTATLIAPNLVLTARHCVSEKNPQSEFCGPDEVLRDLDPSTLYVFVGTKPAGDSKDPKTYEAAAARGKKILTDGGKTIFCGHDLALVLLDKSIPNAKIAPVRFDDDTFTGQGVTAVGWGMTETGAGPTTRKQRKLKVSLTGPDEGSATSPPLEASEFLVRGEGACVGDSGGPVLVSGSNAVIGVVSLVGGGPGEAPPDMCKTSSAATVYTKTSAFTQLLEAGYAEAGQKPWVEGQPDPRLPPNPSADGGTGGGGGGQNDGGGGGAPNGDAPSGDSKSGCAIHPGVSSLGEGMGMFGLIGIAALARRRRASR